MPSFQRTIRISASLRVPASELKFQFSRSGGPGGQNVNKVSSRVVLQFDVGNSPSLTEPEKARILAALKSRIDAHGMLRIASQESRSQWHNRERVVEKFASLMESRQERRRLPEKKELHRKNCTRRKKGNERGSPRTSKSGVKACRCTLAENCYIGLCCPAGCWCVMG
jgi:ribosome-associated protein